MLFQTGLGVSPEAFTWGLKVREMLGATAGGGLTPDSHTQGCHTGHFHLDAKPREHLLGVQHEIFLEVFPGEVYQL